MPTPRSFLPSAFLVAWLGLNAAATLFASPTLLYQTDFSAFPLGDGHLVGTDGWTSTHAGQLVHGTVDGWFESGNRSGTIGFNPPEDDRDIVTLYRPLDYDPLDAGTPFVTFWTDVAVIDSENGNFDSFYFSVFNAQDEVLASVIFDNTEEAFGVWRFDGEEFIDTLVGFEHDVLYSLEFAIDYAANTWSAWLDDTSLFADAEFNANNAPLDLADVSVEWEITDVDNPGDNWLLFDNWTVLVDGPDAGTEAPFVISRISRRPNGNITLRWDAEPNARYQVESSDNLVDWNSGLPNSEVTASAGETEASYADRTARGASERYYRIRRLQP